jgi:hypothetical protein
MDRSPSRSSSQFFKDGKPEFPSTFALPLRGPSPMLPSPQRMIDDARPLGQDARTDIAGAARPRSQPERNELPSIRQVLPLSNLPPSKLKEVQAIPEINDALNHMGQVGHQVDGTLRSTRALASTPNSLQDYPPESPWTKRRKLSEGEDGGPDPGVFSYPRGRQSPPMYVAGSQAAERPQGLSYAAHEWSSSTRGHSSHPPSRSLVHVQTRTESSAGNDFRPTLPGIPSVAGEARGSAYHSESRESIPNYVADPRFSMPSYTQHSPRESVVVYQPSLVPYKYEQPRSHSYSDPSPHHPHHLLHTSDRSSFSAGPGIRAGLEVPLHTHIGGVGPEGHRPGRKRRGNLPKETTDKLRDWFKRHLTHPYPTEDEKQDLMSQTGLQMSRLKFF